MRRYPTVIGEITLEWLTEVLSESMAEGEVESFSVSQLDGGLLGEVFRIEPKYRRRCVGPKSLVAKFAPSDLAKREALNEAGMVAREVGFYREIGRVRGVSTPGSYFAEYDQASGQFLLLMEDVGHLRSYGQTVEDARAALRFLAQLHSRFWSDESVMTSSWLLDAGRPGTLGITNEGFVEKIEVFLGKVGEYLLPEVVEIVEKFAPNVVEVMQQLGREPVTLVHGDFRSANLLFDDDEDGTEPVVAFDWQLAGRGRPAIDLGTFLTGALPRDERLRHEDELLEEYCQELSGGGVEGYSYDELLTDLRRGFLARFATTVTVIGDDVYRVDESGKPWAARMGEGLRCLTDWNCQEVIP